MTSPGNSSQPQRTWDRHERFPCFLYHWMSLNHLDSCSCTDSESPFISILLSLVAFVLLNTEPEWVNRRKQVLLWPGSVARWPASLKWSFECPVNLCWTVTHWKSPTLASSSWCRAKANGLRWVWAECVYSLLTIRQHYCTLLVLTKSINIEKKIHFQNLANPLSTVTFSCYTVLLAP